MFRYCRIGQVCDASWRACGAVGHSIDAIAAHGDGDGAVAGVMISPLAPKGARGRPPFAVQTLPRIHFMQLWVCVHGVWAAAARRRLTTAHHAT